MEVKNCPCRLCKTYRGSFLFRYWEKYHNFTWFPGVEILRKDTVSAKFQTIRRKLCRNCAFPQNFYTRKSGEILVFFAERQLFLLDFLSTFSMWQLKLNLISLGLHSFLKHIQKQPTRNVLVEGLFVMVCN